MAPLHIAWLGPVTTGMCAALCSAFRVLSALHAAALACMSHVWHDCFALACARTNIRRHSLPELVHAPAWTAKPASIIERPMPDGGDSSLSCGLFLAVCTRLCLSAGW